MDEPRPILIAGAGIAGLTAALAFACRGFRVRIFERAREFEPIGAGIQLSPNATRLLKRLGVLEKLAPAAVQPEAVVLKDAKSLRELARVPLGEDATRRWGAPYLVAHRADLQSALLSRTENEPGIELTKGVFVSNLAVDSRGVRAALDNGTEATGLMLVAADGVWSGTRKMIGTAENRFSGHVAWRATLVAESDLARSLTGIIARRSVTAFLHPAVHLITYPLRGGSEINLVALIKGEDMTAGWSNAADQAPLPKAMRGTAPPLARLGSDAGPWTAWPLHTVNPDSSWIDTRGIAVIGDAAHAMTPFAAQGAAMAIEDAVTLAELVTADPSDIAGSLAKYEAVRRGRIKQVARRGAFNHFTWHAAGPVALARDLVLRLRPPERLAADLDWIYGWDAAAFAAPLNAVSG